MRNYFNDGNFVQTSVFPKLGNTNLSALYGTKLPSYDFIVTTTLILTTHVPAAMSGNAGPHPYNTQTYNIIPKYFIVTELATPIPLPTVRFLCD